MVKRTPCMQSILIPWQFFYDEMSMLGRELFNKREYMLREIFGTGKTFGNLHVMVVGSSKRFICL